MLARKTLVVFIISAMVISLAACAAGPNHLENTLNSNLSVAGFWQGVWHGMILPFSLIVSLFNSDVRVYEVHNNGGWYNCGFVLGALLLGLILFESAPGRDQERSACLHCGEDLVCGSCGEPVEG